MKGLVSLMARKSVPMAGGGGPQSYFLVLMLFFFKKGMLQTHYNLPIVRRATYPQNQVALTKF